MCSIFRQTRPFEPRHDESNTPIVIGDVPDDF